MVRDHLDCRDRMDPGYLLFTAYTKLTMPVFAYTRCPVNVNAMRVNGSDTSGTPSPSRIGTTLTSTVWDL